MIAWQSKLTSGMIKHLTESEKSDLIRELDDAVASICEQFEVA